MQKSKCSALAIHFRFTNSILPCNSAKKKFEAEEEDLRAQDIKIQDSMIKFSMYLQRNLRQQEMSKKKIEEERKLKLENEQ